MSRRLLVIRIRALCRTRVVCAAVFAAALLMPATGAAAPAPGGLGVAQVGRQANGSVVTSTNQRITPAGRQVEFLGRPIAVAARPGGRTAAVLNATADRLVIINMDSGQVLQRISPAGGDASFAGLVYSPGGDELFYSQSRGGVIRAQVAQDGTIASSNRIALPGSNPYPGGLALSADGKRLYVALSVRNTLGVIDLATNTLSSEIPVGNAPHDVVVDGDTAYVSNLGGRRALSDDFTNASAGTAIVARPDTGGPATGTVSVVDLRAQRELRSIAVGIEPTALLLHGHDLFVANTNSDTVSVIDTTRQAVATTIDTRPLRNSPLGSSPNALAFRGDDQLVVSLGRDNALALYRWRGARSPALFEGLVPTAWYPGSVILDSARDTLVVANDKGVGAVGPTNADGSHRVQSRIGSVSLIAFPERGDLPRLTRQVLENDNLRGPDADDARGREDKQPVAIPERIGEPSTIKHIFYIVKENRTYDQVMGDDPRGNGDPKLTQFGAAVTPNQHALARRFPLVDNFYASGDLSADGHQWDTQAIAPDYLEKAFGGFVRSYPFNGGDSLVYSESGFLWNDALAHGQSVRDYGEYANEFRGPADKFGRWADWYRDWQVLSGQAAGDTHVPLGTFQTHADVPSLDPLLNRDYPNFNMRIPDVYRAEIFKREFRRWEQDGGLPGLVMLHMPTDHTSGASRDFPTPRAMVADNDVALGQIVDEISHSRYWKDSAIFVTEDDAQAGTDHVDGHRTTGFVISPYARQGLVDSHNWTQTNMVRTIEQVLGMPPMNQMDLAAEPMRELFTDTPDLTPYKVQPNQVPLDEMNPGSLPAGQGPPIQAATCSAAAPTATATSARPPFNLSRADTLDYVDGDRYFAVRNGCVEADIVTRIGENNTPGTFQPGWLANFAPTDQGRLETLDWSELVLARTMNDPARPWRREGEWLPLPDVRTEGDAVLASGAAQVDPNIHATMRTRALPGAPVIQMTLQLQNTGDQDFKGYLEYLLDPDSVQDVVRVPGFAGANPGFQTTGWTGNYLYDGATSAIASPAHGLVWGPDQPSGLAAFGYIGGVWFPADVPAKGTRTITWYHVTDYPASGADVTANIARWAQQLRDAPPATTLRMSAPLPASRATAPAGTAARATAGSRRMERLWVRVSDAMGFKDPRTSPDAANRWLLNHAIWYATRGYATPYPGEKRVMTPAQVRRHIPAGVEEREGPEG